MDLQGAYHFLFETFQGIGVLFLVAIVVCLIACFIMERRTRKRFKNHAPVQGDWDYPDEDE
ncbi:MAG: DUF6724 family protein [Eggerthellaceae bacterium]